MMILQNLCKKRISMKFCVSGFTKTFLYFFCAPWIWNVSRRRLRAIETLCDKRRADFIPLKMYPSRSDVLKHRRGGLWAIGAKYWKVDRRIQKDGACA